jgi:hypothetical protein
MSSRTCHLLLGALLLAGASALVLLTPRQAQAYVEAPHSLGQIVALSTNIVVMRVKSINRSPNAIIYTKVRDIKGVHKQDEIRHNIGTAGFEPREWQVIMAWAEVGKEAVFFHNGSASETCIGMSWYQTNGNPNDPNGWWGMTHGEPYLLRAFAGRVDKLISAVTDIHAGKEVIVPCMVDGNVNDLKAGKARIQRLRASLKLANYDQKRDFVGWGSEDFRRVAGMPAFTHISGITRADPDAQSISVADFNGDGKMDLCLSGPGKVALLQNTGEALGDVSLPGVTGSRASVWADYNGDGLPDLLLAAPSGPKLFTNLGKGELRDDSHLLPKEAAYNVTCAAWIDQDGDGRPDILLGNGWHGLRLYRNKGKAEGKQPLSLGPWHVIGPFDWQGGRAYDTVYPPEKEIDLKAVYPGRGGDKVAWRAGKFEDGVAHSLGFLGGDNPAVAFLHRTIECDRAMKLPIALGSDDGIVVWVNGKRAHVNRANRGVNVDEDKVTIDLKEGKNDLLLKIVNTGGAWGFSFSVQARMPAHRSWVFEDASDESGLGEKGLGSDLRGDTLTVFDADGDGKADFIYGAGKGLLARNTGKKFEAVNDSGLALPAKRGGPAVGDFDGDGKPDLAIPHDGGILLLRNLGGKFEDVTKKAGLEGIGPVTSAAWGDVDNDGKLDLVVGRLRATNRLYLNRGERFEDASEKSGLTQKVFNTQAVALADLNGDGVLDLVFSNEGQDSVVLLGDPAWGAKRTPLSLTLRSGAGLTGGTLRLLTSDGKLAGMHVLTGGEGRGSQGSSVARFALEPGSYKAELLLSSGEKKTREVVVASTHVKAVVE